MVEIPESDLTRAVRAKLEEYFWSDANPLRAEGLVRMIDALIEAKLGDAFIYASERFEGEIERIRTILSQPNDEGEGK